MISTAISSPVFEAMFYGELAETSDSIELPDCEYESLLELLRFMYSDEVNFSGSNVMGVLYLAKKYVVPSLADKCTEYLQDHLDPSNVFSVLPHAEKFKEKNLMGRCWEVIDEKTEDAVKSDGFVTIERSLLEAVVERNTLDIEEVELFKAVNLWATKKCEAYRQMVVKKEKFLVNVRIVKGIRFSVMKQDEFAAVVLGCKILTQDEAFDVVKYLNSVLCTPVGFPEKKRVSVRNGLQRCRRFGSVENPGSGYPYSPDCKDYLIFTVDKDISLLGVTLCGSERNQYSVTVEIGVVEEKGSVRILSSKSGSFFSVRIKSDLASYYGLNILFDPPVEMKRDIRYRIGASISGANSYLGQNGQNSVLCSGVNFNFNSSIAQGKSNRTNVGQGQFPEFLFTRK